MEVKTPSLTEVVKGIGQLLIGAGILYWVYLEGGFDIETIASLLSPQILIPCIVVLFLHCLSQAYRFYCFFPLDRKSNVLGLVTKSTFLAISLNFVLPGGISGDFVKVATIRSRVGGSWSYWISTLLFDRICGLAGMSFIVFVVGLYYLTEVQSIEAIAIVTISGGACIVGVTAPLICQISLIKSRIHSLSDASIEVISNNWPKGLGIALVSHVFVLIFILLSGFDKANMLTLVAGASVGFLLTAIPLGPNGVGVGQAAFFYTFEQLEPGTGPLGVSIVTVFQALLFGVGWVGWFASSLFVSSPPKSDSVA